jgi:hypothetical protein
MRCVWLESVTPRTGVIVGVIQASVASLNIVTEKPCIPEVQRSRETLSFPLSMDPPPSTTQPYPAKQPITLHWLRADNGPD